MIKAHPEDRQELAINDKLCLTQTEGLNGTFRIIRPDGEERWVENREFPIYAESGRVRRFVGSARDITEQKNLQLKLEEANRVKTDFLNAVSHDLRTPLNAILGFTELLEKSPGLDKTHHHYLTLVRRAGFRLHGLINTLLELSRLESGNLQIRNEVFNLRRFLGEQIELLTLHAEEKELELNYSIEKEVPEYVHGDEVRFGQVLYNLIINAIKFTRRGEVSVHAGVTNNNQIQIAVTDSGPGISNREQTRIFEPFTQLGDSGSRSLGTGLGLTISRELSRLMGGDLWLRSSEGEGSTFYFSVALPPATQEQSHDQKPPDTVAPPRNDKTFTSWGSSEPLDQQNYPGNPFTTDNRSAQRKSAQDQADNDIIPVAALVAEDEPTNALLVQTILEQLGATVTLVADGYEALQEWREGSFELLLLDVQMPHLDGLQTVKAIRHEEISSNWDRTHIAMLTAHAGEHTRTECEQAGADAFLTKPIQRQDLLATLKWVAEERAPKN